MVFASTLSPSRKNAPDSDAHVFVAFVPLTAGKAMSSSQGAFVSKGSPVTEMVLGSVVSIEVEPEVDVLVETVVCMTVGNEVGTVTAGAKGPLVSEMVLGSVVKIEVEPEVDVLVERVVGMLEGNEVGAVTRSLVETVVWMTVGNEDGTIITGAVSAFEVGTVTTEAVVETVVWMAVGNEVGIVFAGEVSAFKVGTVKTGAVVEAVAWMTVGDEVDIVITGAVSAFKVGMLLSQWGGFVSAARVGDSLETGKLFEVGSGGKIVGLRVEVTEVGLVELDGVAEGLAVRLAIVGLADGVFGDSVCAFDIGIPGVVK
jgi:hypothetical protein